MPRDGSGIYHRPVGTDAVTDTTIESTKYNVNVADVEQDLNQPRPIISGGTGATSADGVLDNISAEKFKQVITNWDSTVWRAGSYYAATTATGAAPVAGHAFAGICYYANATDLVLEATDLTDPINPAKYIRIMTAGVWGNWLLASGGSGTTGDYTFDSTLTFPPASGQIRFNNATENSTTEIFISHLNALGVDNTGTLSASLKSGYDIFIQDKDEPTKYKIFTANAAPVVTGGDFRITVGLKTAGVDIVAGQRVTISISTGSAVVYDLAQGLTANQMAQARSNIAVTRKNYIINGAMQISQENGTSPVGTSGAYPVDMFTLNFSNAGTQQAQLLSASATSNARLRVAIGISDVSVGATDSLFIQTVLEGVRVSDLRWGSAQAKTVTLQFGCRGPAGTYSIVIFNSGATRTYVAEYVIAAGEAGADVVKSVVIPGDTSGTWVIDNTGGMYIRWGLMAGTTYQQAAGSWAASASTMIGSPNQFNFMGISSNTFDLFDVSLTEGNVAPPFMVPNLASELALCQRYWQITPIQFGQIITTTSAIAGAQLAPPMRAAPTYLVRNGSSAINELGVANRDISTVVTASGAANSFYFTVGMTTAGTVGNRVYFNGGIISMSARL